MKTEDVTVIGAGPGGIAAAIQLKRWGLKPLLLEKDHVGGLLVNANLVENYPGFPSGISGVELVKLYESQMERIGVTVTYDEVLELDYDEEFIVKTKEKVIGSNCVVVASGTQPIPFDGFEITPEVENKIFYEIYPLIDITGKRIAIIGAGDAAFDYSLNLARRNEVTILNRSAITKCLSLLRERASKEPRISYSENTSVTATRSLGNGLVLNCQNAQGDWELEVDYVIFAIGRKPQLDFLSQRLREKVADLEVEGTLHFVGDVKNDIFRQTSIAVGDGVRSAMKICQMFRGAN